jgi:hypothetical protein
MSISRKSSPAAPMTRLPAHGWFMQGKRWAAQATRLSRSATRRPECATISSNQANQPFMRQPRLPAAASNLAFIIYPL